MEPCTDSAPKTLPEAPQIGKGVNTKKLFLALPIYHAVEPSFWSSTLNMVGAFKAKNPGFDVDIVPLVGDSLVSRARNTLTRMFMETDCTHLLFIDSDLTFSPEQIIRMMSHDLDVLGGLYCKKQDGPNAELVINACADPIEINSGPSDGLMTVRYVGTGFLLVKREVFQKMIEKWPDIAYKEDPDHTKTAWDIWHTGVYDYAANGYPNDWPRRYLSEDWWFCQRCQDLGIKVWVDRRISLKHTGSIAFPLKHQEEKLMVHKPISKSPSLSRDVTMDVKPAEVPA